MKKGSVTDAKSKTFCANSFTPGGYYPGVKNCANGRAKTADYVEDDPNNSTAGAAWAQAKDGALKGMYLSTGVANGLLAGVPTNNSNGCLYKDLGGCIDYSNAAAVAQVTDILKKQVDKGFALGANVVRPDAMDVCENGNGGVRSPGCRAGYLNMIKDISDYAAGKGMGIMPSNSAVTQKELVAHQSSGGATVVGSMIDSSTKHLDYAVKNIRENIGNDIPIFTVTY